MKTEKKTSEVIEMQSAYYITKYWEDKKSDSNVYVQFVDFDKIEVFIDEEYEGDIEDAIAFVKNVAYNARIM